MALTNTERSRRRRRHIRGDHSLCDDPEQCKELEPLAPMTESRGDKLYRLLSPNLGPETIVVLEEAARLVDRLDRLDDILTGNRAEWMRFIENENGEVTVKLNNVVDSARLHAGTLAGLMREVRAAKASSNAPSGPTATGGISGLADELAPRRKAAET
jgi:hypothetical protein